MWHPRCLVSVYPRDLLPAAGLRQQMRLFPQAWEILPSEAFIYSIGGGQRERRRGSCQANPGDYTAREGQEFLATTQLRSRRNKGRSMLSGSGQSGRWDDTGTHGPRRSPRRHLVQHSHEAFPPSGVGSTLLGQPSRDLWIQCHMPNVT